MKRSNRIIAVVLATAITLLSLTLSACVPATTMPWPTATPTALPTQPVAEATPTQVVPTDAPTEAVPTEAVPTPYVLEGARTTSTGLQYLEEVAGSGDNPKTGDLVTIHYIASLPDGTELVNTYTQNQPATTVWGDNRLLPGWEEGIGLMKPGGKAKLALPPDLAFGEQGTGAIPPNTTLIIEVELLAVEPSPLPTEVPAGQLTEMESGLQYYDIELGTGTEAITNANVSTGYAIWVKTDTGYSFIDRSLEGDPLSFVLGRGDTGIAGWEEGTRGMKVGGKRLLIIPPELALGSQSNGLIPANSTLVIEVVLLDVKEPQVITPVEEADYTTTESGLKYFDIITGTGDIPQAGQTVVVQYTGWLEDGTQFDSSLDAGQPFTFVLGAGQVIPGWDEGVASMMVGGKRQLVIPPALGYGDQGAGNVIPPGATLIFEVELLEIQ